MKKIFYTLICFLLISRFDVVAQAEANAEPDTAKVEPALTFSGTQSLTFTQTAFKNWAAGGANSVSGVADVGLKLVYKKDKITWETTLNAAYGLTYQESDFLKNTDKIDFLTKFGLRSSKKWDYSAMLQLKTQFYKGYKSYPPADKNNYTSKLMAPGYVITSIGMDYKPNDNFSFMLSPVSAKFTFVLDTMLSNRGDYGVTPGKKLFSEIGSLIRVTYSKKLKSQTTINSNLELFSSWLNNFGNIDMSWEFDLNVKINKWFSSKFYTKFLYDDDIKMIDPDTGVVGGPRLQFKQQFGVGISLSF